ncbi:MAG: type II toxin-antitoxin system RelE/ParE family toxin [Betaproteobacteria bacterium]|nr:type II toxin-antitoxin system RelE/ParE family toxin [Betaproteobacteria bacterium]
MRANKSPNFANGTWFLSIDALEVLKNWPDISGVKNLTDAPGYRLRIGQYRAFFDVAEEVITVTEVKRRNERTY